MILNKNYLTIYFIFFLSGNIFSQNNQDKPSDSTKLEKLEEVVITGQYNPQSIKKSVFEVNVITRKQIDLQAGNNLADILNQSLNISIIPNSTTGKSSVQLFGLDGQYVKILVDNIPLINDEGLGNNTDLSQINLDDIQQIEIVEGSMGVQYGSNAVSGVINIITKKKSNYKWTFSPYIQEETIGNEYGFFDEGRHIQSFSFGYNFFDNVYVSGSYTRNDFKGFLDYKKGLFYEWNDGLRGYSWLPKIQNTAKFILNFSGENNFRSFYKFEYFDEQINQYSEIVQENFNGSTNTYNPTSNDAILSSERFYHHLNFSGTLKELFNYDLSFSYQNQKRDAETYKFIIKSEEKTDIEEYEYQSRNALYTKGNFSNFLSNENFNFQLGYEINTINGYASSESGSFNGENIKRKLGSYDVFGSSEISFNSKFSIRPGARLITSSLFKPQAAISLVTKYIFKNDLELRLLVGSAPRLPNYAELFTYFVDANHDVRGNENLKPEQGTSVFVHIKKKFKLNTSSSSTSIQTKLSFNYLDLKNRIELSLVNTIPLQFKYINIDSYKTIGLFFNNKIYNKNFTAAFGVGYSGQSKVLDSQDLTNNDYLFAPRLNANISYTFRKIGIIASTFLKYNGRSQQFVQQQGANDETILVRGEQDSYSMIDASILKNFSNNKLQLTFGARNLFNVTQVNTTAVEGGTHSGPPNNVLLGYGRSYYLKLVYNLKIN